MPAAHKHAPAARRERGRRAFSLVEIIAGITLTAVLLSALTFVTFNLLGVWADQAEDPLFDRHVDGLRRALEECIMETNDSAPSGSGQARQTTAIFSAAPGDVGSDYAPYLRITGAPPFLSGETQPLGYVHAWLKHGEDGLALHWQTDAERRETTDATHRLILSPWVSSLSFTAYDKTNNAWQDVDGNDPTSVPTGSSVFMQLSFKHRGQTRQFSLPLADGAPHNLNY
jgi:hypothetical protein